MIKYIQRQDIDVEKYDLCIENSINSRIYAYSWYLDIVADNWDVLVLGDYEVVMPIPWRSKYFIKYIYPPCWTQQLGVFSSNEIDEVLVRKFIKRIPKKFRKVTILFNSGNPIEGGKVEKRVNYILRLDKPYGELFQNFGRTRKPRVNKVNNNDLRLIDISFKDVYEIFDSYYKFLKTTEKDYLCLNKLTDYLLSNSKGGIFGVYDESDELIGASILLFDNNRITYLNGVATQKGKRKQSMTFLINSYISKNSNTNFIFDFEGSMIEGVAEFYKSFGSVIEEYSFYQNAF